MAPSLPPSLFTLAVFLLISTCAAVRFRAQPLGPDHQAHAKPGGPYFAVDWKSRGEIPLTLSAADSHTHYFDHGPPPVSGTVRRYEWYSGSTDALLLNSTSPYFSANFFLGITVLKLTVTDSVGDKASAYTYVSVREPEPDENEIPRIRYISPVRGPKYGGTVVTVFGDGFYNSPTIGFAGLEITPEIISENEIRFRIPAVSTARTVWVYVSNGFGSSGQYVEFRYVATPGNPIKFHEDFFKNNAGQPFPVTEITSIALGPDRAYYAGSLNGFVHILGVNRQLTVRRYCKSHSAGVGRSILGVAFNPNQYWPLNLYITTSTLFWGSKGTGDIWDNGKVEVWAKRNATDCISHSETIISGLPVSPNDHSVNGLLFHSDGSLLVAVGGSTNAGVHTHGDRTGGLPETVLSSAILRFKIFDDDFDGHIKYVGRGDPGKAHRSNGTVEVYAAGVRNVFGMTIHSNGEVYAMDNGPNPGFGVAATGCNTVGKQVRFQDKLLHIKRDGWYGHPNWARGRYDPRQCAYRSGNAPSDENFTAPMAELESSTSGITEYTANTFSHQLRGKLILSKLSWGGAGKLWTATLDETKTELESLPEQLYSDSGIAVVMGPFGELIMPKIKQSKIIVLVPDEPDKDGLNVIAVVPRRGPARGGNSVMITGSGFEKGVKIYFGNSECTEYGAIAEDGTSVLCQVPKHVSGSRSVSVVAKYNGRKSEPSGLGEYEYMKEASKQQSQQN